MHKPTINIIGCGKLGKTIAKLLVDHDLVKINGLVNSTYTSADHAKKYIGEGIVYKTIDELPPANIYLIATKDDAIKGIADELHHQRLIPSDAIVFHCSGSLTSDVLASTKQNGCYIASIHPIKSFADPNQAYQTFPGTYCAMEGDKQACDVLNSLFEKIGGRVFSINKAQKQIYHAGGVIANNYLITLHYHAMQCYIQAGIEEKVAKNIVSMLINDGLNNLAQLSHQQALTGPIQRGDIHTIEQHLIALTASNSKELYTSLGVSTLELTNHPDEIKKALEQALTKK